MKGLMIMLLILSMVTGCASMKTVFCKPTPEQLAQAEEMIHLANDIMPHMKAKGTMDTDAIVQGINLAITIFKAIKDGICVPEDQVAAAKSAIAKSTMSAAKYGYRRIP